MAGAQRTWHGAGYGVLVAALALAVPRLALAQRVVSQAEQTIQVERGKTSVLLLDYTPPKMSAGDTTVISITNTDTPREWLINGLKVGSTTLIIWDPANSPHLYNVEVTADATALQRELRTVFPGVEITVTTSGEAVILSGTVRDPAIARRAVDLATQTGAKVIDNLQAPSPQQVLLQVRFAEVRRTVGSKLAADLFANNAQQLDQVFGNGSTANIETLSDGIVRLFLIGRDAELDAIITALKSKGEFRSLAEPNLLTVDGKEASFLAGGEFPYPIVQQGSNVGAVSIQFKEFGVRLKFTPVVNTNGTIRLSVEPEVSSLDFANGLTLSGFQIPSLLTRRAKSEVELRPGQHLAIAGLLDNAITSNVDKIPILGDIPIVGALFRNKSNTQARTELLVIVTPQLVQPSDSPIPLPTGEPGTWKWNRSLRIDTTRAGRGGGG